MSTVFLSTAAFKKDSGADTAVRYLKNGITKVELSEAFIQKIKLKQLKI